MHEERCVNCRYFKGIDKVCHFGYFVINPEHSVCGRWKEKKTPKQIKEEEKRLA